MAMGMKMGNIDSTQGNESINQKKETETEKKIKPITDKEIQRVNEQLKDPEFKKHLKLLKYLIAKKDSLPEAQQIPIDNALKNIKENLQRILSDKSELFTDKWLSMLTGSKEYPHQENWMIDNTNADTVAT